MQWLRHPVLMSATLMACSLIVDNKLSEKLQTAPPTPPPPAACGNQKLDSDLNEECDPSVPSMQASCDSDCTFKCDSLTKPEKTCADDNDDVCDGSRSCVDHICRSTAPLDCSAYSPPNGCNKVICDKVMGCIYQPQTVNPSAPHEMTGKLDDAVLQDWIANNGRYGCNADCTTKSLDSVAGKQVPEFVGTYRTHGYCQKYGHVEANACVYTSDYNCNGVEEHEPGAGLKLTPIHDPVACSNGYKAETRRCGQPAVYCESCAKTNGACQCNCALKTVPVNDFIFCK